MNISELEQLLSTQKLAPLESWNPQYCGEMDLEIKANGQWFYMGSAIKREKLVQLFSRVLLKENDSYYLITPVEKIKIKVADAPFIAIDFEKVFDDHEPHPWLVFKTNVGDTIKLSQQNPLLMNNEKPYILVRRNLLALLTRSTYYDLVEVAQVYQQGQQNRMQLFSGSDHFDLGSLT